MTGEQRERGASRALVVAASSMGTVFEWYDFFVFGTLASTIAHNFTAGSESAGFLFALGAFAAGFFVRPFGALFFGHIGDRAGRKRAFLLTISIMGAATVAMGLLPTAQQVGLLAPVLLVLTRVLQGFAMGGEYGGAAVYVAEHAEPRNRGFLTGWIQATAALGLVLALAVVLATRLLTGEDAFQQWGWRVPFLLSAVLLGVSLWIRLGLSESPVFERMKRAREVARAPVSEAFRGDNLRRILTALFCILLAQGAVWYTAHFYAQFFLERVLKVEGRTVNELLVAGVVLSAGGYVFFGWLSDRVGRKPVMLAGMVLSAVAYVPAFQALTAHANPALEAAASRAPVTVYADPADCHLQFDVIGRRTFDSSCDVVRRLLSDAGIPYRSVATEQGALARVTVGAVTVASAALIGASRAGASAERTRIRSELQNALASAGYPPSAAPAGVDTGAVLGILVLLMLASTALYGPQAAALVELFPARIRYTALSVPYNIGTGWVGGLLPVSSFAIVAATGNIYSGLAYPLAFTLIGIVATVLLLPETRAKPLDELRPAAAEGIDG
ncbi:MAG TPA: MFS transporter [Steroidobacteraceae bacterium]|jgi:MFS family permease|nr:MFS transporter [Steroidobacteraceae bacterium]